MPSAFPGQASVLRRGSQDGGLVLNWRPGEQNPQHPHNSPPHSTGKAINFLTLTTLSEQDPEPGSVQGLGKLCETELLPWLVWLSV